MVGNHIHRSSAAFEVLAPMLEGLEDGQEFLVMGIVVEFRGIEGAGVESDWMKFAVGGMNG